MRRLWQQSWLRRPWTLGVVGLMALNLWAGCSEQPPKAKEPASVPAEKPATSSLPTETDANSDDKVVEKSPPPALPAEQPDQEPPATEKSPAESDSTGEETAPATEIAKAPATAETKEPGEKIPATTPATGDGYGKTDDPAKTKTATAEKPPGDLFEGWPEPVALLLLSGDQRGYIEPCGCAGLENQKGGLKRRHTFVKQMHERGWPLALFDLGEQVRRFGIQPEIKYRTAIQSLEKIGYKAIGFGPDDLQLPAEQMLLLDLQEGKSPFVSANVVNEFAPELIVPYRVVTVGNKKIAVTTVLGPTNQDRIRNEGIKITPAAEAIAAILPKMKAEADFLVLMSASTLDEAIALGKQFTDFNLVVTASGADEPPLDMRPIEGTKSTYLVDLGGKGMFLAAIGLYDDPQMPLRYKPIPLDKRFEDSPEMQTLFVAYQNYLKAIGLKGLDLNIRPHARGAEFVGSDKCGECHTKAFAAWKKTPHSHATETLMNLKPQRQFDSECLSCHVTGWELNPGTYVPYLSGYYDDPPTPHLFGNGCENCHGPGSEHVKAESGDIDVTQEKMTALREQMKLPLADAEATCVKCHDPDNSPNFSHEPKHPGDLAGFAEYWKHVEHKGKD